MKKQEKLDLTILLIHPVFAALLSHLFSVNCFTSVILFLGLPALYLTIKSPRHFKKAIIFSLVTIVPLIIIIDYLGHINNQWIIPNSILPYRLFGFVTIEVIFWAVLNLYYVIIFYEYFLDKHYYKRLWHPHMKYLLIMVLSLFVTFILLYFYLPSALNIPYFYFFMGIFLLFLPVAIELFERPGLVSKFFKTAAYFFYLTLTYEITALQLGWWDFPSTQFIGWITILDVKFPLEELISWLFLFAMAILTYYEYFDSDNEQGK